MNYIRKFMEDNNLKERELFFIKLNGQEREVPHFMFMNDSLFSVDKFGNNPIENYGLLSYLLTGEARIVPCLSPSIQAVMESLGVEVRELFGIEDSVDYAGIFYFNEEGELKGSDGKTYFGILLNLIYGTSKIIKKGYYIKGETK